MQFWWLLLLLCRCHFFFFSIFTWISDKTKKTKQEKCYLWSDKRRSVFHWHRKHTILHIVFLDTFFFPLLLGWILKLITEEKYREIVKQILLEKQSQNWIYIKSNKNSVSDFLNSKFNKWQIFSTDWTFFLLCLISRILCFFFFFEIVFSIFLVRSKSFL